MNSLVLAALGGAAVGEIAALALVVALSPVPIVAVVLLLTSPHARVSGPAFVGGWVVGLAVVGALVLLVSDGDPNGSGSGLGEFLKLALGVLLILVAVQQLLAASAAADRRARNWMGAVDRLTPARAGALGFLLAAVYPKTVLLTASGAASIAETMASAGAKAGVLAGFILVGTLGVATPVVIHQAMGERSERVLGRLRAWIDRHSAIAIPVLFALIGATLVIDAIIV
jgi:hypothetical protein